MLVHVDLFSGIGGFALAARWTGKINTVAFCEKDPYCRNVIGKHWPGVPIIEEIESCTSATLLDRGVGHIDIITGGFPCQPYSLAGKKLGRADDRALWPEMLRVIHETKPTWVVGENVAGFVSMAEFDSQPPVDGEANPTKPCGDTYSHVGQGTLLQAMEDLEKEGYEVQPIVIPACATDAWHRRDRVWIIAHREEFGRGAGRLPIGTGKENSHAGISGEAHPDTSHELSHRCRCTGEGWRFEDSNRHRITTDTEIREDRRVCKYGLQPDVGASNPASPNSNGSGRGEQRCDIAGGEELAASQQCSWWETESELRGVPDGLSSELDSDRTKRLKGLGNAIVPQVAYQILSLMLQADEEIFAK